MVHVTDIFNIYRNMQKSKCKKIKAIHLRNFRFWALISINFNGRPRSHQFLGMYMYTVQNILLAAYIIISPES